MEDIIDIIVTETTNLITITSSGSDEVIDVNIIDNREDIVLNVTPTVVEININSLVGNFGVNWGQIGGTLTNQTDLNTALGLKADLVGGKVPSSQLPSYVDDVVEVANYAALPATGETGKIYVTIDTNYIYRWTGSVYVEIKDSSAVWGAITGTLSNQTDLQNALNAKFDDPTGDTTQYIAGDGSLITFPTAGQAGTLVREVRNTTGATLTKGTIVYISGATGNKPTVSKAIATGDSTSAQTFGMVQANISNNANGYVVCVGDIVGLDTSAFTEGNQLYLSSTTAGTYTTTKQLAPAHLVYIGIVTRAHPTLGQIEVNIQNGYELYELHDVSITTVADNQGLFYELSTDLWKNKSIATVLGYTPANDSLVVKLAGAQTITGVKTFTGGIIANVSTGVDQGFASTNTSTSDPSIFLQNNSAIAMGMIVNNSTTGDGIYLSNDTSGRALYISNATLSGSGKGISIDNYNGGIGIEVGSDSSADAIKVLHISGRAFNIQSSGGGYGVIINNSTASTSAPFTIQKQGATVISMTDAGAITGTSFVKTGGTSAQFLKANGTVDSTAYLPLSGGTLTGALNGTSALFSGAVRANNPAEGATGEGLIAGQSFKIDGTGTSQKAVMYMVSNVLSDTYASGLTAQFANFAGDKAFGFNLNTSGGFELYVKNTSFNKALTISNTNAVTLTGALSGTSATFSSTTSNKLTLSGGTTQNGLILSAVSGAGNGFYIFNGDGGLGNGFGVYNTTTSTLPFYISNAGAATFSSSVTASTGLTVGSLGSGSDAVITLATNASGSPRSIYYKASDATINFTQTGGANLMTLTNGGNLGIGTTAPTGTYGKLSVAGGISILNDNNAKLEIGRYSSGIQNSYIKIGSNSNSLRITNSTDVADVFIFNNNGSSIQNGINVQLTKTGGTSIVFTLSLGSIGAWTPGYATIRVSGTRGGLQEHYAAMYFLKLVYFQSSNVTTVNNVSGDTGSASIAVTTAFTSGNTIMTITISDVGASTDYMIADIDASFQTGIGSIT